MDRQHEVALQQALDEVYLDGATSIRWDYLYLWFKAKRLSKTSYREIQNRWDEMCTAYERDKAPPLSILSRDHTFIIMRGAFENEQITPLKDWL